MKKIVLLLSILSLDVMANCQRMYSRNQSITFDGIMQYSQNQSCIANKMDELLREALGINHYEMGNNIIIGSETCMFDRITYKKNKVIFQDSTFFECISIGKDYNNQDILSFEISHKMELF